MEVVCSAPSLCSHQLTHQSVIMAKLVPNSWTTIGESGFIIRLRGAGNWGLRGLGDQSNAESPPRYARESSRREKRRGCFKVRACRTIEKHLKPLSPTFRVGGVSQFL